jgi:hypothetical protein
MSTTTTTTTTAVDVLRACELAQRLLDAPRCFRPDDSVVPLLSRALLRVRELLQEQQRHALVPGSRLRVSVKLLQDLHDMPGHESVTCRLVRVEYGGDGVGVLVLEYDERPS